MTQTEIINQIRTNSNVAYEANELSERLTKLMYVEESDVIWGAVDELNDIVKNKHKDNEQLFKRFKKLRK